MRTALLNKVMGNMAVGIKIIKTVQTRFSTKVLLMLFHALGIWGILLFFQIVSPLVLSLQKRMNRAMKSDFFRFSTIISNDVKRKKNKRHETAD